MLKKILFTTFALLLVISPVMVGAVEPPVNPGDVIEGSQGGISSTDTGITDLTSLLAFIQSLLGWVFAFALIIGVALMIIAGIMYMTAGSDQDKTGKAIKMIISAIIGIVVAGLAWSIVAIIQSVLVTG